MGMIRANVAALRAPGERDVPGAPRPPQGLAVAPGVVSVSRRGYSRGAPFRPKCPIRVPNGSQGCGTAFVMELAFA